MQFGYVFTTCLSYTAFSILQAKSYKERQRWNILYRAFYLKIDSEKTVKIIK